MTPDHGTPSCGTGHDGLEGLDRDRYGELVEMYQAQLLPHEGRDKPCSLTGCPVADLDVSRPTVFSVDAPAWARHMTRLMFPVLAPGSVLLFVIFGLLTATPLGSWALLGAVLMAGTAGALPLIDTLVLPRYQIGCTDGAFHLVQHFQYALAAARARGASPEVVADLETVRDDVLALRALEARLAAAASTVDASGAQRLPVGANQVEIEARRAAVENQLRALVAAALAYAQADAERAALRAEVGVTGDVPELVRRADTTALLHRKGRGLSIDIDTYRAFGADEDRR